MIALGEVVSSFDLLFSTKRGRSQPTEMQHIIGYGRPVLSSTDVNGLSHQGAFAVLRFDLLGTISWVLGVRGHAITEWRIRSEELG